MTRKTSLLERRRPGHGPVALVAGALVGVAASAASAQPQPAYQLFDLGTLGGPNSAALAANGRGDIVGWSEVGRRESFQVRAVLWSDDQMIDLGSLGGSRAEARGVNSAKQVVGFSENADGVRRAFYAYDGVMQDLNDLVDRSASRGTPGASDLRPVLFEANAINNNGHIIANGTYPMGEQEVHSFLLVPNGFDLDSPGFTAVDMGFLPTAETGGPGGPRTSYGLDLNDFDQVVGAGDGQAFLWLDDDMYQLEFVASESQANAINYFGIIVGWSAGPDGRHTAGLWSLWLQGMRWDLMTPAGWSSEANDLNDFAEIVGWAAHDSEMPSAMLWSGDHVYNLNSITSIPLGPGFAFWDRLEEATGIDEHHRIVGFGRMTDGTTRAFLLTPMPVE